MSILVGLLIGILISVVLIIPAGLVFIHIEETTGINYHALMMTYCGFMLVLCLILLWFVVGIN